MSIALADVLIEFADPIELQKFEADPEGYMKVTELTDSDKAALRSRRSGWIRYQAKANAPELAFPTDQESEITAGVALDVIDVIDVVEVVAVI